MKQFQEKMFAYAYSLKSGTDRAQAYNIGHWTFRPGETIAERLERDHNGDKSNCLRAAQLIVDAGLAKQVQDNSRFLENFSSSMDLASNKEKKMSAIIKTGNGKPAADAGNFKLASIEDLRSQAEEISMIADIFGIEGPQLKHLKQAYFYSTIGNGLVPDVFKGDYRSIYIMGQVAESMNCTLVEVLQGAYFVHGRFAWYAEFMIKRVMQLGVFIKFDYEGGGSIEEGTAWTRAVGTWPDGTKALGTKITLQMARAEGWFDKKGSKWLTMPGLMLKKRAATFLIRESAPHIFGGMTMTVEESEDIGEKATAQQPQVIEAGKQTDATMVMASIVKEERDANGEKKRTDLLDQIEKVIADKYKTGDQILELENKIQMSLDAISDLKYEQLTGVWEAIEA